MLSHSMAEYFSCLSPASLPKGPSGAGDFPWGEYRAFGNRCRELDVTRMCTVSLDDADRRAWRGGLSGLVARGLAALSHREVALRD
jgi:hypothetical protein